MQFVGRSQGAPMGRWLAPIDIGHPKTFSQFRSRCPDKLGGVDEKVEPPVLVGDLCKQRRDSSVVGMINRNGDSASASFGHGGRGFGNGAVDRGFGSIAKAVKPVMRFADLLFLLGCSQ